MRIEYDPLKNERNAVLRNLPFDMVYDFDFDTAFIEQDERHSEEIRMIAIGKIELKIYTLVFTMRGDNLRVISFRYSSKKEQQKWHDFQTLI